MGWHDKALIAHNCRTITVNVNMNTSRVGGMESFLSFLLFTFWFWLKLFLLMNQSIPGSLKCLCLFSKYFNWITQFFLVLVNMNCFFFIMFVGLDVLVHITFDSGLCYLELLSNDHHQLVTVIVNYVLDLPNDHLKCFFLLVTDDMSPPETCSPF